MSQTPNNISDQDLEPILNDPTFLDAPEVEVMPGVYMTDFAKIKREAEANHHQQESTSSDSIEHDLADEYIPTPGDLAAMQSHQSSLQNELQMLEMQLAMLHQKLTLAPSHSPQSAIGPIQLHDPTDSNGAQISSANACCEAGEEKYMTLGELTGLTGVHLLEQIRLKIGQVTKHHEHLKSSQDQLQELLHLNDDDITEAYTENKITLQEQLKRLQALRDEEEEVLKTLSPHYAPPTQQNSDPTPQSDAAQPQEASKDNTDAGVWL